MDQKPELTAKVIAALDACRHDSEDRGLPEVASALEGAPPGQVLEYRRTIERIDRAVAGAMQEVAVPSGLAERILAGVRAHSSTSHLPADQDVPADQGGPHSPDLMARPTEMGAMPERRKTEPAVAEVGGAVAEVGGRAGRPSRRLVMTGAILAMAASLLVALVWQGARERPDVGDLQAQAKAFYEADDHSAPLSDARPAIEPPVATQTVSGWRSVTFLSRPGTAFELASHRPRAKGTLYVVPLSSLWGPVLSGMPTTPVLQGTSGMTIAVWRDSNNVYVMVVQGGQGAFESFFAHKFA